ncbi:hypothetical protein [Enterobacter sp. 166D1]|uniref:hypothetical protein n=1 Tax=Enterobacter TaxID=547 RepID=UPI002A821CB9|nr:hypothetical protein [Enterobacter sp. 166D1]
MKIVSVVLFLLFILSTVIAYGYSLVKNKEHLRLCDAFKARFGYIPAGIILSQAGGVFFAFQKDFYFISPFIFKKGSFAVRNMESEHYDFIRSLPKNKVTWLLVKFALFLIMIILFFATIVTSYLF